MNDSKLQNIQNKLDSLETQMGRIENKLDRLLKDFEILNE
jgi:peptidoglycan hydrolase CwlO-like protein